MFVCVKIVSAVAFVWLCLAFILQPVESVKRTMASKRIFIELVPKGLEGNSRGRQPPEKYIIIQSPEGAKEIPLFRPFGTFSAGKIRPGTDVPGYYLLSLRDEAALPFAIFKIASTITFFASSEFVTSIRFRFFNIGRISSALSIAIILPPSISH